MYSPSILFYTIQHLCSLNICGKTLQYADDTNIYYYNRLNNLQPCTVLVNRDKRGHPFSTYAKNLRTFYVRAKWVIHSTSDHMVSSTIDDKFDE